MNTDCGHCLVTEAIRRALGAHSSSNPVAGKTLATLVMVRDDLAKTQLLHRGDASPRQTQVRRALDIVDDVIVAATYQTRFNDHGLTPLVGDLIGRLHALDDTPRGDRATA